MRSTKMLAVAIVTLASLPLMAQPAGAAQATAKGSAVDYAQMQPVSGELVSRLDSKSARVGEPVVLKTTQKTQNAGGMVIPKGSQLLGHVTEVQAHTKDHKSSRIGIEFDRAVLKNGQSFAIHSTIDSVSEPQSMITEDENAVANAFDGPGPKGSASGGTATAGSGLAAHGLAGDAVLNLDAAGGQVHPSMDTGIPGVMLSGDATGSASGVLSAAKKNFRLDSGTQMVVGIVAAGK